MTVEKGCKIFMMDYLQMEFFYVCSYLLKKCDLLILLFPKFAHFKNQYITNEKNSTAHARDVAI